MSTLFNAFLKGKRFYVNLNSNLITESSKVNDMSQTELNLTTLVLTIQRLRSDAGCPWDRKQTTRSLKKYLVEEFEEIIGAIDNKDSENLCEELGDFLYLILMIGEISKDKGAFTIEQIISGINEKLIRRHPHVFKTRKTLGEKELHSQWAAIKESEKVQKNKS